MSGHSDDHSERGRIRGRPGRDSARSHGHAIGVLILDEAVPFVPGSVGHPSTYSYPVLFRTVAGLKFQSIYDRDPACRAMLISAARELQAQGVRAIAGNCGFMLPYQEAVADAVEVPVFLSSLMQLPLIAASSGRGRGIGIITADEDGITCDLLAMAGLDRSTPVAAKGMNAMPEFRRFLVEMRGSVDPDLVRAETVEAARSLVAENSGLAAILLECSELPPYAEAVQRATGMPTYDFLTLIEYFHMAGNRRPYSGAF